MFKLVVNDKQYVTQTQKKYFKLALQWCLQNDWNSCRVNRIYYNFDFENLKVNIISGSSNNTYDMLQS